MRVVLPAALTIIAFMIVGGCLGNAPPKKSTHVLGDCNGVSYEYSNQTCCQGKVYNGPYGECGGTCFNGKDQKCCNNKIVPVATKCCVQVVQPDGSYTRMANDTKECTGSPDSIIQFCKKTRSDSRTGCTECTVGFHYKV
jgi:hypothetical protein